MKYKIALRHDEEGYSVSVPGLPGEGKHTVMSDGQRILTIPRHNPVNAFTMAVVCDAGLTPEEFRKLL